MGIHPLRRVERCVCPDYHYYLHFDYNFDRLILSLFFFPFFVSSFVPHTRNKPTANKLPVREVEKMVIENMISQSIVFHPVCIFYHLFLVRYAYKSSQMCNCISFISFSQCAYWRWWPSHFIYNRCFVAHLRFIIHFFCLLSVCVLRFYCCRLPLSLMPVLQLYLGFNRSRQRSGVLFFFIFFSNGSTIKIGFDLVLWTSSLLLLDTAPLARRIESINQHKLHTKAESIELESHENRNAEKCTT